MSWLVFARWMVGALFVCLVNPYWFLKASSDPWLMWIATFVLSCVAAAVFTALFALFLTPTPLARIRNIFVRTTWIVMAFALSGAWTKDGLKIPYSTLFASIESQTLSMTQSELQQRVITINAGLDRSSGGLLRNDSVVAGPGLRLTYTSTFSNYTATQVQAAQQWPALQSEIQTGMKVEACGPKLVGDDLLQRGVIKSYVFLGNDGQKVMQVDISKAACAAR